MPLSRFDKGVVGAKARNTKALNESLGGGKIPQLDQAPKSMVIPFGTMEHVLEDPINAAVARRRCEPGSRRGRLLRAGARGDAAERAASACWSWSPPRGMHGRDPGGDARCRHRPARGPRTVGDGVARFDERVGEQVERSRLRLAAQRRHRPRGSAHVRARAAGGGRGLRVRDSHREPRRRTTRRSCTRRLSSGWARCWWATTPAARCRFASRRRRRAAEAAAGTKYVARRRDCPRCWGTRPRTCCCKHPAQPTIIFRSDSNGEDLEGYAGAGLYESVPMDKESTLHADYSGDALVWDAETQRKVLTKIAEAGVAIEAALGGVRAGHRGRREGWRDLRRPDAAAGVMVQKKTPNARCTKPQSTQTIYPSV